MIDATADLGALVALSRRLVPTAVPHALALRRLTAHARAIESLPHGSIVARLAMGAELVRLAAAVPGGGRVQTPPFGVPTDEVDPPASVLDPAVLVGDDDTIQGLRFDAARQTYLPARVAAVVAHTLHLRIAQFLEWEIDDLDFVASRAIIDRLVAASMDPSTGAPLIDAERIAEVIAAIADAAPVDDPSLAPLTDARVDVWLSASNGGDLPVRIEWELPPSSVARLYGVLDDTRLRARLFEVAASQRVAVAASFDARRNALAAVLEQHRGVPKRHKRVHWAFLNLASANQTTAEMRRPSGVLPRDATSLEPASLRRRYASTPRTALRFVLTDRFELNVLGDARYWDTIAHWGFPPNHETLAGTRPIMASGYLTIDRGRIVAIEDDGVMVPGKLPPGLPPIQEVLEALGFDLDLDRVAGASLVVDWDRFADATVDPVTAELPELAVDRMRDYLAARSHAERPALVVAWIRRAVGDPDAVVRATAELLRGFRLINVSGRAVAAGELPKGAEWIDAPLAGYLVRKVATR